MCFGSELSYEILCPSVDWLVGLSQLYIPIHIPIGAVVSLFIQTGSYPVARISGGAAVIRARMDNDFLIHPTPVRRIYGRNMGFGYMGGRNIGFASGAGLGSIIHTYMCRDD